MHRSNNAVIMQTEQLGRIEALEEELRSSRGKVADLEQKMMEQDQVITQLVGDNLDHLQDNMRLTAHINSSTERMAQMEHRLGQVGSVVMGFLEGTMEGQLERSVIVMTFRYVFIGTDLIFFELFNFYSSLGIDYDPPCSLCSHDLCLFPFLMFHSSHDHMAKRSHYRIMIFLRLRSSILRTHSHPHSLLLPPQLHHPYTPRLYRSTTVLLGGGYHPVAKCGHPARHDCTEEDSHHSRLGTAMVKWVLPSRKSVPPDGPSYREPSPD